LPPLEITGPELLLFFVCGWPFSLFFVLSRFQNELERLGGYRGFTYLFPHLLRRLVFCALFRTCVTSANDLPADNTEPKNIGVFWHGGNPIDDATGAT
jgi:hypothetical protein